MFYCPKKKVKMPNSNGNIIFVSQAEVIGN